MPGMKPKERDKYQIRIGEELVEVSREVYLCYHHEERKWRYQEEKKIANGDCSLEGLTDANRERFGSNSSCIGEVIADESADVWEAKCVRCYQCVKVCPIKAAKENS